MAKRIPLDWSRFETQLRRIEGEIAQRTPPAQLPARIVVITKYLDREATHLLLNRGVSPLGENRAPEVLEKATVEHDPTLWHFVGHLQRNKVNKVLPRISVLHSLDSERLATSVDQWAADHPEHRLLCLVQVNVSEEPTKGGLPPAAALEAVPRWSSRYPHLRLAGLMTMAPLNGAEECRPYFRILRELRDRIRARLLPGTADRFCELSMGMSNDYRVAAEEGATWIRLGRVLYE